MTEAFTCGDTEVLVAYAYGEAEPAVRTALEVHLGQCVSCARQIEDLRWTRRQLAAWTPPPVELGFRISDSRSTGGEVLGGRAELSWWRSPLPAWAQAAAAVLVFGAGLAAGLLRPAPAAEVIAGPPAASQSDLAALEERMRGEVAELRRVAADRPVATPATAPSLDEAAVLRRVETMVAESERRQRLEFTERAVDLTRDFEAQRRVERAWVSETLGQFQGVTGAEVRQQREAIEKINRYLVNVSQPGR